jgi:hypothetical protein
MQALSSPLGGFLGAQPQVIARGLLCALMRAPTTRSRSRAAADGRARAGHYYNRAWVISGGCLIWGVVTVGFSLARTLREGIFFWAFNGLGLALVRARGLL